VRCCKICAGVFAVKEVVGAARTALVMLALTGVVVGATVTALAPTVIAFVALMTGEETPDCMGCVAGLASEEVVVAPKVALACDCTSMAGACAFRVAAASAAGVLATNGEIATFTIWGNPLVKAGVAVTATMLDTFAMAPDVGRGGDEMRATLERVSAGELVGRIWGIREMAAVGMIFLGKIIGCVVGGGGTRLLLLK
jgi:hypothetical protein